MTEFTSEFIAKQKKIFDNPELDISIWVAEACGNYYLALDYIERLQKRVEELEMFQDLVNRWSDKYYRDTNKLKQRIAELEQERRWIPVSERNPHSNGLYDVWITGVHNSISAIYRNGKWNMFGVTHWRCKPQPLKEVNDSYGQ